MEYKNAAEILPQKLLKEIQSYAGGSILYIPKADEKQEWGTVSGSRIYYSKRNQEIREHYQAGTSIEQLSQKFGLAYHTIRKIIYQK